MESQPEPPDELRVVGPRWGSAGPGLRRASRLYLIPMLGIVLFAVVLLEHAYLTAPAPPGPDTAKWIVYAYPFGGRAFPSAGSLGSPYAYPPFSFLWIGLFLAAIGGPIATGFAYGGALLVLLGLTTIHLARRFLGVGSLQVAVVAVTMLNVATLSMFFWGAYPNLLALSLLNETLVFFLAFVRFGRSLQALAAYGLLSLVYLTHELTFVVGLGTLVLVAGFLLLAQGRATLRRLLSRAHLLGALLLVVVVALYQLANAVFALPHAGYFFANPATPQFEGIGQVFQPVAAQCGCALVALPNDLALGLLLLLAGAVGAAMLIANGSRRLRLGGRGAVHGPLVFAGSYFLAACVLPIGGWLLHIDTDYNRFGYFFPLPAALLVAVALEPAAAPRPSADGASGTTPASTPSSSAGVPGGARANGPTASLPPTPPDRTRRVAARQPRGGWVAALLLVAVFVVYLMFESVPVVASTETFYSAPDDAPPLFEAIQWLRANATPGAVLTVGAFPAHWTDAVALRDAYYPEATYIEFFPQHIVLDEETAWAYHAEYGVTNNRVAVSVPGSNDTIFGEAPLYSAYIDGVLFGLLRVDPTGIEVALEPRGGGPITIEHPSSRAAVSIADGTTLRAQYHASGFVLNVSALAGVGTSASIGWTVEPLGADRVVSLTLPFRPPPAWDPYLIGGILAPVSVSTTGFTWTTDASQIGAAAGLPQIVTTGQFSIAAAAANATPGGAAKGADFTFTNPQSSGPLAVNLQLSTAGASNPAVVLPPLIDSPAWLADHDVRFVLLPIHVASTTGAYLQQEYGFRPAFQNTEWFILAR
jgi:hypothetical protein